MVICLVCHWLCKTIILLILRLSCTPWHSWLQPTFPHFSQLRLSSAILVSCDFVIILQSPGFHTLDINLLILLITPDSVYKPCNYSFYTSSVSSVFSSSFSTSFLLSPLPLVISFGIGVTSPLGGGLLAFPSISHARAPLETRDQHIPDRRGREYGVSRRAETCAASCVADHRSAGVTCPSLARGFRARARP